MKFKSTRGAEVQSFSEAFNQGLAIDGGLFVPEYFPNIQNKLDLYSKLSYPELVAEFMSLFAEEIPKEEWMQMAEEAYVNFDAESKVLIKSLTYADGVNLSIMELFHGPTLAFKDFALQMVGKLYERECKLNHKTYIILGATSGDTGSAAIYSVLGNEAINIFIMYPDGKIAAEQELQMTTTGAKNVFPIAIRGTFDDAQSIVKEMFADTDFAQQINLAAVNSINIARILVQSVYYLFTYLQIYKEKLSNSGNNLREGSTDTIKHKVRFIVPTGNFGNILSGWMLNNMGLDCEFVLATNENDVLHTLWQTGEYKKKIARETLAPSMDIQQASNFERLLYFMYKGDSSKVCSVLSQLKETGTTHIDINLLPKEIISISTDNLQITQNIKDCYQKYAYILDPHTACAFSAVAHNTADVVYDNIILATASPAKFPDVIKQSIGIVPKDERLEVLKDRERICAHLGANKEEIKSYMIQNLGL